MPLQSLSHATRQQVFNALFALIQTIPVPSLPVGSSNWKTASQRIRLWDDVNADAQPAIFLQRGPQAASQSKAFGVTRWHWKAIIWVYFRTGGLKTGTTYPDQLTDQFLDGVEQVFQTDPMDGRLTLGGLVHHCWLDGSIFCDPGIADEQAVLVVPVSILL